MSEKIPSGLIDRYLSGEATSAEQARVEAWLAADPAKRATIDVLRSALRGAAAGDWDVESGWVRQRRRIEGDDVAAPIDAARRPRIRFHGPVLRAALLAGLLIAGWGVWRAITVDVAVPASALVSVVTAAGQQDTVALADGSTVIVAPASRLTVTSLDALRGIELQGEAFFSVATDPERPFRVQSAGGLVEVLGTEFSVRSREATALSVAVRAGRVSLSRGTGGPAITLTAGQVGRILPGGAPELVDTGSEALLSWLAGVLEFEGERVDEIVVELSRWFGRAVELADTSLADRRVSGRFVTADPGQALDALALALGTSWAVRDGAYVLGPTERN